MITAIRMIKMNPANVPPMMKISEMESRPDPLPSAIQNSVKLIHYCDIRDSAHFNEIWKWA